MAPPVSAEPPATHPAWPAWPWPFSRSPATGIGTGRRSRRLHRVFKTAQGTNVWNYGLVLPPDGFYTVSVQATDNVGNTTATDKVLTASFVVDTVAPPAPTIVGRPTNPSSDKSPEFTFVDREPDVRFHCTLDGGPAVNCIGDTDRDDEDVQGEIQYTNLATGTHCFTAIAIDKAGNASAPTEVCWTISGNAKPFAISGNASQLLYPGTSQPLELSITNPNSQPITIASGGITIAISTTKAGCGAATNFAITHGLTASVTIPANSTRSLSALGVAMANWPVVAMIDTHANQNVCQATSLTLTYTGTATG